MRVISSLALLGLLLGWMIGRLTMPEEIHLLAIEVQPSGLSLWFDYRPEVFSEVLEGTYAVQFKATGAPAQGQLSVGSMLINWRLRLHKRTLVLGFVAVRPLLAQWRESAEGERWRVDIQLASAVSE